MTDDATDDTSLLAPLRRQSGALAMLAVDQREALRNMMATARADGEPVTDADLTSFKVAATRILSPFASGVLIDRQFGFDAALAAGVIADRCGLIAAADHFIPAHGQLVGEVQIDPLVDPGRVRDQGAVAMKLLVLHRTDQSADNRRRMVDEFIATCAAAGVASIIEPVCRPPLAPDKAWDHDEAIIAAATELGRCGADLYKGEMPMAGRGPGAEMRERCRALTATIDGPWVILSSGVAESDFAHAVTVACSEGASGFLAGRAVWASCLSTDDVDRCLHGPASDRLQAFATAADLAITSR